MFFAFHFLELNNQLKKNAKTTTFVQNYNLGLMKKLVLLLLVCSFFACNNAGNGGNNLRPATAAGLEGFLVEEIPGSEMQRVVRKDAAGNLLEEGFVLNGQRTGAWLTYKAGSVIPIKIESYSNGLYNGPYMELNDRGQVELLAGYKNNRLHGNWGKFRFGRPEITAVYQDSLLNGPFRSYFTRDGKLQKEAFYTNGVPNGPSRQFDETGRLLQEVFYKNGEIQSRTEIKLEANPVE